MLCPRNHRAQWVWSDLAGRSSQKGALTKSTHSQEVCIHGKRAHRKWEVETPQGPDHTRLLEGDKQHYSHTPLGSVYMCPEEVVSMEESGRDPELTGI